MKSIYEGHGIEAFLNHAAQTVPGPFKGIMPHRMNARLRSQIEDPLFSWNEFCPSGISLELAIKKTTTITLTGYALDDSPQWISLVSRNAEQSKRMDVQMHGLGRLVPNLKEGSFSLKTGNPMTITLEPLDAMDTQFTVMLSHTCLAEIIGIESDDAVTPNGIETPRRRWTHYGSSISHGAQSQRPADRWLMQVAQKLDLDLTDLSLSGNAQLDQAVARTIANQPADFITCAIGINLVNADSMRERTFMPAVHGFLDTVRDRQPQTPLIVITACTCPMQENTPGPVMQESDGTFRTARRSLENDEGALTLSKTREMVERAVEQRHDPFMTVMNGLELLGPSDAHSLRDNLHPDQAGIDVIASRFATLLPQALRRVQ